MKGYDAEIKRRFYREFKINHRIQRMSGNAWLFNFVVRKVKNNPDITQLFTGMFNNMDTRKLLTKPSFYIKLLVK